MTFWLLSQLSTMAFQLSNAGRYCKQSNCTKKMMTVTTVTILQAQGHDLWWTIKSVLVIADTGLIVSSAVSYSSTPATLMILLVLARVHFEFRQINSCLLVHHNNSSKAHIALQHRICNNCQ